MDRNLRPVSVKNVQDAFSNAPPNRVYNNQNLSLQENLENVTSQLLLIDSNNKNNISDTNSKYTIDMPENFEYVISVQLVDYKIPVCNYNITEYNNTIYFIEHNGNDEDYDNSNYISAKIKCGKYTISELLKHFARSMECASQNKYKYVLLVDNITGYITVKTKNNSEHSEHSGLLFDINFSEGLLHKVLGFDNKLYSCEKLYTSNKSYDLEGSKFISISITTNNGTSFKKVVSTCNESNGCFTVIPTDENYYNNNIFMKIDFNSAISFGKLMFEFRDDDGNLFNFNGRDHYLLFDVKKCFGRVKLHSLDQLGSGH